MNLIDIVKKLPWPDGAVVALGGAVGRLVYAGYGGSLISLIDIDCSGPFLDEVVTHEEWLAAQEPVEQKEREPGYYWVRVDDEWDVSKFDGEYWDLIGDECAYADIAFDEIDERRIVRQP